MRLHPDPPEPGIAGAVLTDVDDHPASGLLTEVLWFRDAPPPAVGWCLSSDPARSLPMEPAASGR